MTVQDLRPNSQDTSAFYLGNIYVVLANPNATRGPTPTPVAKPPRFSAPRYAVWVNLLWFLSLVMSVSCALLATSLHQWARRYIRLTQPARCSPEKRARMRAFFANGVGELHIPWAVEGLPTLLHLSLFLFFGGLLIFLFNIDQEVFNGVVWWIALFSAVYGLITLLPLIRQDSPYSTPLSIPAWFLYAGIQYVASTALAFIANYYGSYRTWERCDDLRYRYRGWMLGGVEKIAEKTALEQSSEIDVRILGWTIGALGDDDLLEKFFEAIPGFFNSKLVKHLERDIPETLLYSFWGALYRFMGRTLSSNSVSESVKSRRAIICGEIMSTIPCSNIYVHHNLWSRFDQAQVSIERLQAMARWFTHISRNVSDTARTRVAENLARMQDRDDRWVALAARISGLPERDLRDNIAHGGDNVSLAILIQLTRKTFRSDSLWEVLMKFSKFDICNTLPKLQHNFCTLWNEIVQEAKNQGPYTTPVHILRWIRHLYIALHQDTDATPTVFSPFTNYFDPSSYPLCEIASHHPDSTAHVLVLDSPAVPVLAQPGDLPNASPHHSTAGGPTVSRQVKEATIVVGPASPSDPTTPGEIGDTSQALVATEPAKPVCIKLQDISPAATLSHRTTQRDIVAPCTEPDISEILSTASTPLPAPPVLNKSLASCDTGAASASNSLLPTSSVVGISIPASPPSCVPPLPNAKSLSHLSSTTPSRPTGNSPLPRLRARGLMNTRSMCFSNAVLQLLVHSPPFWNLFRQLGDLKGQCGAEGPEAGGRATPLVDATVRFLEEFVFKEEPSPSQQPPQQTTGRIRNGDEDEKKEHEVADSFELTYMYDAMKEMRHLKSLLVTFRFHVAPYFY